MCCLPYLGQVNEAEEERLRGEREHQRVTRLCQQAEARVQALQKTLRRAIGKSRPYFELKAQFSQILEVATWRGGSGVLGDGIGTGGERHGKGRDRGAGLLLVFQDQCGGPGTRDQGHVRGGVGMWMLVENGVDRR